MYSTLDKELLGICVVVEYWDVYIFERSEIPYQDRSRRFKVHPWRFNKIHPQAK